MQGTVGLYASPIALSAAASGNSGALLSELRYDQVEFADCPARRQFEQNQQLLLNLSEDSLLRPFRVREGLPAPGESLGGWYAADAFAPGHAFGQWLSSLARMYAATSDEVTRTRLNQLAGSTRNVFTLPADSGSGERRARVGQRRARGAASRARQVC